MASLSQLLRAMGDGVRPGQRFSDAMTAERINAIIRAIRVLARGDNIISGLGMQKKQVADGVILTSTARGRGGSSDSCPFDASLSGTTMTFRPGTVNGMLPSNYLTGLTVPLTGTRYIVLDVTVSSGAVTAVEFAADASVPPAIAPSAGEPPTAFKILVGVLIEGVFTKVWGCGNIQALPVEAFRLEKAVPVVGQLPYDVYYTWELSVL